MPRHSHPFVHQTTVASELVHAASAATSISFVTGIADATNIPSVVIAQIVEFLIIQFAANAKLNVIISQFLSFLQ